MDKITVEFKKFKEHKSCVRFNATSADSPVKNIYVDRPLANNLDGVRIELVGWTARAEKLESI